MPHKLVFGQKIKSPTIVRQAASWARRQASFYQNIIYCMASSLSRKTESRVKNESFSTKCSRKKHIVAQNFIMTFQFKSFLDLGSKISLYQDFSPIGELLILIYIWSVIKLGIILILVPLSVLIRISASL